MDSPRRSDTPLPRSAALRWLTDAGPGVPPDVRAILLDGMTGAPLAAIAGPLSGIMTEIIALALRAGLVFWALLTAEIALLALRAMAMLRAHRGTSRRGGVSPDLYLLIAAFWCALQGALGFAGMDSGSRPLQILVAVHIMALTGPICARNFAAPRYAMFLLGLCFLPLVAGAQRIGEPVLLVLLPQAPLLFLGAGKILERYQDLAITALLAQARERDRAAHDSLTGLLNRAGLAEHLAKLGASPRPCGMFYLDLDGFKPINDTFGHAAGDRVLVDVAERLRACVRKGDIVARLGGDEFVLVIPGITPAEADIFAARIVRRLSATPYVLEPGPARVGASVGYACAPDDGRDFDDLGRMADAALYVAKSAGRGTHRRFIVTTPSCVHDLDADPCPRREPAGATERS